MQETYLDIYTEIIEDSFKYSTIKQVISEWVEENLKLPNEASRIAGRYSYDNSPFVREIIDRMHPSDPCSEVWIMKGSQCGITTGFVVPFMMWCIVNNPTPMLFTSKDKDVVRRTMRNKFDLFMQACGYQDYIRSNNKKAGSKRTGDTDFLKEYAGGSLMCESTQNIQNMREHSAEIVLVDEADTAKEDDKKEGSMRTTLKGRQQAFGDTAKMAFISTPTVTQTSNIYKGYLEGDQRKWNWNCPKCNSWSPVEFQVKNEDGEYFGLVWKLDSKNKLIPDSIRYKFPCCGHEIEFKDKYEINIKGKFIPTAEPLEPGITSYSLNSLILGPGFTTWEKIVREFLKACPPGKPPIIKYLKAFNILYLGLPFKETGEVPKATSIMSNIRGYKVGTVPDELSRDDGNDRILFLTLVCDLGGVMKDGIEDVRLDYEVVAHSYSGSKYSIDQGSIGSFKRNRTRTKEEVANDENRKRWTYNHGVENSVWPKLDEIANKEYISDLGEVLRIGMVLIDVGFFTKLAYQYIRGFETDVECLCFGIKGDGKPENFTSAVSDKWMIKKSTNIRDLYLLNVNLLKDDVSANMKLVRGEDGFQQPGTLNFPQPTTGKYTLDVYFKHYESEARIEEKDSEDNVIGFKWNKKNTSVENHFWDLAVYTEAAKHIMVKIYRDYWVQNYGKEYSMIEWEGFAEMYKNSLG